MGEENKINCFSDLLTTNHPVSEDDESWLKSLHIVGWCWVVCFIFMLLELGISKLWAPFKYVPLIFLIITSIYSLIVLTHIRYDFVNGKSIGGECKKNMVILTIEIIATSIFIINSILYIKLNIDTSRAKDKLFSMKGIDTEKFNQIFGNDSDTLNKVLRVMIKGLSLFVFYLIFSLLYTLFFRAVRDDDDGNSDTKTQLAIYCNNKSFLDIVYTPTYVICIAIFLKSFFTDIDKTQHIHMFFIFVIFGLFVNFIKKINNIPATCMF